MAKPSAKSYDYTNSQDESTSQDLTAYALTTKKSNQDYYQHPPNHT